MDVGQLVVAEVQAAKLIQPGERALHDPPPSAQAAAMPRSAHGEQWEDLAYSQALPDDLRVVRAVTQHAVGTTSRSSSLSLQERDRIDERQGFSGVVAVGPVRRTANGTPRPSQITWRLLPGPPFGRGG
jgi:hypothetical protein